MQITNIVENAQAGELPAHLAQSFGITFDQATKAAAQVMKELAFAFEKRTISRGGLADVVELLGDGSAGRAFYDASNLTGQSTRQAGDHILDVLVGDKHQSRGIAQRVARETGVSADVVKGMLPVVASAMVGGLQRETQAAFSRGVRDIPGLGGDSFDAGSGTLLPLPGENSPRSRSTGDWGDALPRTGSTAGGGAGGTDGGGVLLPLPGDNVPTTRRRNRYDDLSDVLRRGPTKTPQGGSLEKLIRSILGNLLGYGNRGIIGSIIRVMLLRWGWTILRRILGRIIPGR